MTFRRLRRYTLLCGVARSRRPPSSEQGNPVGPAPPGVSARPTMGSGEQSTQGGVDGAKGGVALKHAAADPRDEVGDLDGLGDDFPPP